MKKVINRTIIACDDCDIEINVTSMRDKKDIKCTCGKDLCGSCKFSGLIRTPMDQINIMYCDSCLQKWKTFDKNLKVKK